MEAKKDCGINNRLPFVDIMATLRSNRGCNMQWLASIAIKDNTASSTQISRRIRKKALHLSSGRLMLLIGFICEVRDRAKIRRNSPSVSLSFTAQVIPPPPSSGTTRNGINQHHLGTASVVAPEASQHRLSGALDRCRWLVCLAIHGLGYNL